MTEVQTEPAKQEAETTMNPATPVIQVRNLQEEPLEAELSVFVPALMETPSTQPILLRPKAVQTLDRSRRSLHRHRRGTGREADEDAGGREVTPPRP